jgi:hypothetical protein
MEMKRTIMTLALAGAMMLLAVPAAFANSEYSQDTAGETELGEGECRPGGTHQDLVGSWTLWAQDEFEENYGYAPGRFDATWTFCDKNRDGNLCIMITEISPYYWTLLDNRPFGH